MARTLQLQLYTDLLRKARQYRLQQVPLTGILSLQGAASIINPSQHLRSAFINGSPRDVQGKSIGSQSPQDSGRPRAAIERGT
jgi:hypothetical protein